MQAEIVQRILPPTPLQARTYTGVGVGTNCTIFETSQQGVFCIGPFVFPLPLSLHPCSRFPRQVGALAVKGHLSEQLTTA